VFLWQSDHTRLLYWNKFGTPVTVLDKVNREDMIPTYWWIDPERARLLAGARQNNTPLQPIAAEVRYQE
jgi:microcin C transport system substrate-binding protein